MQPQDQGYVSPFVRCLLYTSMDMRGPCRTATSILGCVKNKPINWLSENAYRAITLRWKMRKSIQIREKNTRQAGQLSQKREKKK